MTKQIATDNDETMTVEQAEAFLAQMMPNQSPEVRLAVITLAYELASSDAPNGIIYTVGPNKDAKRIVIEVRHENGMSAAQAIVDFQAKLTALKEVCAKFLEYRRRNTINFQLEKADDFFNQMRRLLDDAAAEVNHVE